MKWKKKKKKKKKICDSNTQSFQNVIDLFSSVRRNTDSATAFSHV